MKATIQYIKKELTGLYPETEIKAFTRVILEHVCGLDYTAQILMREDRIDSRYNEMITKIVTRLKKYEPIQYIFEETEFFGLKLHVNHSVLIPRPETEELLHWIIETKISDASRLIDIGTGSGCIALSLKKQFPEATVTAVDISIDAIEIARRNASKNNLEVSFLHADILKWEKYNWKNYDLIVSNPPYVRESEKAAMFSNVLKFEPGGALFVPDSDPLLFYRKIASFAQQYLNTNGWLFFEINEKLGRETEQILEKTGFRAIEIKNDLFGKERMLRCRK